MSAPTLSRSGFVAALVVIAIAAGALRLHRIGRESLWLDEAFAISISRVSFSNIVAQTSLDVHPPLYYFVLRAWMQAFGDSEAAARALSAVFSVAVVVAAAGVGARLFDRRTAIVGALVLAVSPFQVEFAQEARMYALLALLGTLSTWSLVGLIDDPPPRRWRWVAAYVAATSIMTYTHIYSAFVIAAHGLAVAWIAGRRQEAAIALRWIAAQIVVAVLFIPWMSVLARQTARVQQGFWIPGRPWIAILQPLLTYAGSVPAAIVALGLAIAGVVALRRSAGQRPLTGPVLLPWFLCPIVLPFVLSRIGSPIFLPKYTIAASVPFALLVAHGLTTLRTSALRGLAVAGFVVVSAWPLHAYYTIAHKNDWRTIAAHIEQSGEPGDAILFYRAFNFWAYDYYRHRSDIVEGPLPLSDDHPSQDVLARAVQEGAGSHRRVWLVTLDYEPLAPAIVNQFLTSFVQQDHVDSVNVEAFLFTR